MECQKLLVTTYVMYVHVSPLRLHAYKNVERNEIGSVSFRLGTQIQSVALFFKKKLDSNS